MALGIRVIESIVYREVREAPLLAIIDPSELGNETCRGSIRQ